MNPNDLVRRQILQYFYDRNANATSRMGKKGSAVKISDAKRELKAAFGLSQQQVMSNLTYLIDNGWVKTVDIEKTVTVRGGTIPQITTFYEITSKGIDKIEGGSQFEPKERYAGININASGSNIITLGDGNVVNARFRQLHADLEDLKQRVTAAPELSEAEKLQAAVDIETIKDQLAKPEPNIGVVRQLWSGLGHLSIIDGVAGVFDRVQAVIVPLLSAPQ